MSRACCKIGKKGGVEKKRQGGVVIYETSIELMVVGAEWCVHDSSLYYSICMSQSFHDIALKESLMEVMQHSQEWCKPISFIYNV